MDRRVSKKLDFTAEQAKLREKFKAKRKKVNVLLTGETGSGKTFLLSTAPKEKPCHVDSFDPGGSVGLRSWAESGDILIDDSWENDDVMNPTAFTEWEKEFDRRAKGGYFDHIGWYMLDSFTSFSRAAMYDVLKKAGIPGEAPRWKHDYTPQKQHVMRCMSKMLSLPCSVIVTGHLKILQDEVTKQVEKRLMATGDHSTILPGLFDEVWVMDPKKKLKGGADYRILTQSTGVNLARSRLSANGLLEPYETPDLEVIMKKAKII